MAMQEFRLVRASKHEHAGALVLVAEGDHELRRGIRDALVQHGYEVIEAEDGASAMQILASAADGQRGMPDVVVLDVRMSGYSGLGVLSVMRRFSAAPPAIVVSSYIDSSIETVARRLGARHLLRKPIDVEQLLAMVFEAAVRTTSGVYRATPHAR